ncbi:ArgS-related anticodon-binding protein NrtL [Streptomyces sp. NPDC058001]|uniref:ArgS-related anticodon-binding protein NrtL n=1 Tax=Streptomyces sp. NPDC058001 TaxID=3346300 RepID=UPI0036EB976E
MTPVDLSRTVLQAVRRAVDGGELAVAVPVRVVVERTRPGGSGDYATNVALQLARPAGRPARQVAEILRHRLLGTPGLAGVDITGPGFLSLTLDRAATTDLVAEILREGTRYGYGDVLAGQVIALHIPHETRAEVIAGALTRIIASQGGQAEIRYEPSRAAHAAYEGTRAPGTGAHTHVTLRPTPEHPPAQSTPHPGDDARLWSLLHPAPHDRTHPVADLLVQRESNPLFRVRYAYSRTRALTREAAHLGFTTTPDTDVAPGTPGTESVTPDTAAPATRHSGPPATPGTAPAPGNEPAPLDRATAPAALAHEAEAPPDTDVAPATPGTESVTPDTDPAATLGTAPATRHPGPPATLGTPGTPGTESVTPDARPAAATPGTAPAPGTPATHLLQTLAEYPPALQAAARHRTPDRLARHLLLVADAFLGFYSGVSVLPVGDEKPLAAHRDRLALAEAAGAVLAGGLDLLGMHAPEHL